ncbi:hypothetical protein ACQ4PT_053106 [Festuca glaucescens]
MESLISAGSGPAQSTVRRHVVLLASPDAGHLIPLLPTSVTIAPLPAVQIHDFPTDALRGTVLVEIIRRSLPSLRTLLRSISTTTPIAALVPDFLCSMALPLAAELGLGVQAYIFFPSNATFLYLKHCQMELHNSASPCEYRDLPEPLELPGGLSLRRADLPEGYRFCKELVYAAVLAASRRYRLADGFLANTFHDMEPATVEAFKQVAAQGAFPPVFCVGPLVRSNSDDEASAGTSPLLEWLDHQPVRSVVYVSFGSGGALSVEQTAELAAGLEASGHRFLWVVRMPSLYGRSHAFGPGGGDPLAWLPEGFVQRTKDRGLAVAAWAPQVDVLSHPATAAFVSHCGWNSTLESAVAGVPVVAWPLHTEQRMNALVLEESLGVALRPRAGEEGGVVAREEVAAAVKELMEGENGRAVRRRTEELKQAAARALSPGGSSRRSLEDVAAKWKAAFAGIGEERRA